MKNNNSHNNQSVNIDRRMHQQPSFSPQYQSHMNPIYYQQKANQLRTQNQLLKKQLQNQNITSNSRFLRNYSPDQRIYENDMIKQPYYQGGYSKTRNYQIPQRTVVYRRVGQPIITERVRKVSPQRYTQPERMRTSQSYHNYPRQHQVIAPSSFYSQYQHQQKTKRFYMNQTHGYKLQREANKLSSFIKEDLRDFVRDSNIHKQCNYKKKYLKAISNRPIYVRFNM